MKRINLFWKEKPLQSVIIIALALRLLAAVFSQGYGMHDDHYLVIEASQSWADGTDYNDWLPKFQKQANPDIEPKPQGHSFFYVGIHYLLFQAMDFLGMDDPKAKMFLIRLLHALFSLIVVVLGYKITLRLSNEKSARQVGILLAALWVMPFLSVRNLVEIVCIPFLFLGIWYLLIAETRKNAVWFFLVAGLFTGLAFSIRFQSAFFILGMGISLLILKKIKGCVFFSIGVVLSIVAVQGVIDMFIWNRPFAEMIEYINYNNTHKFDYGANLPEMYPSVLIGLLIPPIGLLLFFGFFRTWRKYLILFIPVFLFFAFHEYFPNKQERFILPILPFYIMLGIIGWNEWVEKSKFWQNRPGLLKGFWIFFWVINIIMLGLFTLSSSKKSKLDAMYYFYKKGPVKQILIEDTNRYRVSMLPGYYSGQWFVMYSLGKTDPVDTAKVGELKVNCRYFKELNGKEYFTIHPEVTPEFVLFYGEKNLEERVNNLEPVLPSLTFEAKIEPSLVDKILFKLNSVNQNENIYIYKVKK